jgi:hypothetical protein
MRLVVINSLFGLLARQSDYVVLLKIIFIFLKIEVSFGVGTLLHRWSLELYLSGYGGLILERNGLFFF